MDKIKTFNGRRFRTEGLIEIPVPPPYDPTAMPGAIVLGTDGALYASQKDQVTGVYVWSRIASLPSGRLLLGLTTARSDYNAIASQPATVITPFFQMEGDTTETTAIAINAIGANAARVLVCRANGTVTARTGLVNGDQIGLFQFGGFDGTRTISGAQLTADVDGTVATNDMPLQLRLRTRATGVVGTETRLTVRSSGTVTIAENLQINNSTSTERFSVTGNAQLTDSANYYMVGTNPVVGSRKTGWAAPTGTASRATFNPSSVLLPDLAARVKALIDDLTTHGLIGA